MGTFFITTGASSGRFFKHSWFVNFMDVSCPQVNISLNVYSVFMLKKWIKIISKFYPWNLRYSMTSKNLNNSSVLVFLNRLVASPLNSDIASVTFSISLKDYALKLLFCEFLPDRPQFICWGLRVYNWMTCLFHQRTKASVPKAMSPRNLKKTQTGLNTGTV